MTNNNTTIATIANTIASTCPSHDISVTRGDYAINLAECEGAVTMQWLDRVWNPGAEREVIEVGAECPNPCAG